MMSDLSDEAEEHLVDERGMRTGVVQPGEPLRHRVPLPEKTEDEDQPESYGDENFRRSLIIGAAAKGIVRAIMESAGYTVYPFGFESAFAVLKQQMAKDRQQRGETAERIRSMPDLLAIASEEIHLVEVKFRSRQYEEHVPGVWLENGPMMRYQKYWPESILLLVSPYGHRFFVAPVCELRITGGPYTETFHPYDDFTGLHEVFARTVGIDYGTYFAAVDNLTTLLYRQRARRRWRSWNQARTTV